MDLEQLVGSLEAPLGFGLELERPRRSGPVYNGLFVSSGALLGQVRLETQ